MSTTRAGQIVLGALALATTTSPLAHASGSVQPLTRGISDGGLFASTEPSLRQGGREVTRRARAIVARIPIAWTTVVRDNGFAMPPSADQLGDPAHPTYDWSRIDTAVREISQAGLKPMAYFLAAPRWAEAAPRYRYAAAGTWAPAPEQFGAFATAVARRYSGTYPDPTQPGTTLPRIDRFQTWNEPNLGRYLQPLWVPHAGRPALYGPATYRALHRAAERAIHAVQPTAKVGLAGLASGTSTYEGEGRMAPLRYLRALLCIGKEAPRPCGPRLRVDALALHPLTVGDPDRVASAADDVSLSDLEPKVTAVLRLARKHRRLQSNSEPELWVTEMNWLSEGASAIRSADQALVVGRAMRYLWQAGATLVNWQFAVDPALSRTEGAPRPGGLTRAKPGGMPGLPGRPKAFLRGFALPTTALPVTRSSAHLWALAPPNARSVTFQRRHGGAWQTLGRVPVRQGAAEMVAPAPRGTLVRAVAGGLVGSPIVVRARSGVRAGAASVGGGSGVRADWSPPVSPPDPRGIWPSGPGVFSDLPPRFPNGMPDPVRQARPPVELSPRHRTGVLRFRPRRHGRVLLGARASDRYPTDVIVIAPR